MSRKIIIGRVVYSRRPRPFNFKAVRRVWANLVKEEDATYASHLNEIEQLFAILWFDYSTSVGYPDQSGAIPKALRRLLELTQRTDIAILDAGATLGLQFAKEIAVFNENKA